MYYYDSKVNKCYPFIYGGCGGNLNRFATEGSCLGRCRYILGKRDLPILTPIAMPISRPVEKPVAKPITRSVARVVPSVIPRVVPRVVPGSVIKHVTRPQVVYYPRRKSQIRSIASSRKGQRDFGLWNSIFRLG